MTEKLPCDIVRDLLPSYADGLTGETTNAALREHLADCADCAEILQRMKEPEAAPSERQVDLFKKLRRRSGRLALLAALATVAVVVILLGVRFFLLGSPTDASLIHCQAQVEGNRLTLTGSLSTGSYTRALIDEEEGVVTVTICSGPSDLRCRDSFQVDYQAAAPIRQIYLGQRLLWQEGVTISAAAAALFATVHPYVGDMPANSQTLLALGVYEQLGACQNQLHTAAEPYRWTLSLDNTVGLDEEAAAREIMQADACVLLATVGNLSEVEWIYSTKLGQESLVVTAEDATAALGQKVKECSRDGVAYQEMLVALGLQKGGLPLAATDGESGPEFVLCISQDSSSSQLQALYMEYQLDAENSGGQGVSYADNSALRRGDTLRFQFTAADFPTVSEETLMDLRFDLTAITLDGQEIPVCPGQTLSVSWGREYYFRLQGDETNGFTLTTE